MAKRNIDDNIMMRPRPNARLPWLVILLLLVCLGLVYWGFLRAPEHLLGPKIPPNEYEQYLHAPRARPRVLTTPPAPAAPPAPQAAPAAPPAPPPAGGGR